MSAPELLQKVLMQTPQHGLKVVLIGDSGVGKSTIYDRLESGVFNDTQATTIGGAFARINAVTTDRRTIPMGLWDTAGQERYKTIIPVYFERANIVLLVYDITNRPSFDHLPEWLEMCKEKVLETTKFVIVGNKCDLADNRAVLQEDALAYSAKIDAVFTIKTSAKSFEGIDQLLQGIADEAIRTRSWSVEPDQTLIPSESPSGCC
jgi:small GTP-binding protein